MVDIKSAICGEYVIAADEKKRITVYRIFDNAIGAMREVSEANNFAYEEKWNTRTFGKKLCQQFGDGRKCQVGSYFINILESGSVEIYRVYDNTIAALREVADKIGFAYEAGWNTQHFGAKLISEINSK